MRQVPLQYVSKSLHARFDHITKEPLPELWVELIHYLDETKRRQKRGASQRDDGTNRPIANL